MPKTPDEIKKGLDFCARATCGEKNADCPYECGNSMCIGHLQADALAYIQQLQADNAQQARCIENMTDMLNAAHDEAAKLQVERDALMNYLHSMGCETCLYDDYDGSEPPCINCTATCDLWQFQGVQKEEQP